MFERQNLDSPRVHGVHSMECMWSTSYGVCRGPWITESPRYACASSSVFTTSATSTLLQRPASCVTRSRDQSTAEVRHVIPRTGDLTHQALSSGWGNPARQNLRGKMFAFHARRVVACRCVCSAAGQRCLCGTLPGNVRQSRKTPHPRRSWCKRPSPNSSECHTQQ